MTRGTRRTKWIRASLSLPTLAAAGLVVAFTQRPPGEPGTRVDDAMVQRGRTLVMEHACGACHGGMDPASDGWLTGYTGQLPLGFQDYQIGPFHTYARNITPDNLTGIGRFSERQIFNALRYGLRPGETPDVEITSTTPGRGNFPASPKYLAPPMPWTSWRHMPDDDLWAIAAYLKHGVKSVRHRVEDSEGPPDFWASEYVPENVGTYPAPAFPTAEEREPPASVDRKKVLRGRHVVMEHACKDCHGTMAGPAAKDWLVGRTDSTQDFRIGPCGPEPDSPCFVGRPRNLTPDEETGVGRYTERQIFNVLRYGLRPSETPDGVITSATPGMGNHPAHGIYVSPAMPWMYWRHMADDDLWAVAAYLKYGLKPVRHHVDDSGAPPDAWASEYTPEKIGTYPPPPFPTAHETGG